MAEGRAKKVAYMQKIRTLLETHKTLVMVTCDNIGAHHMQKVRKSLRGQATLVMGKNTLMRKAIRDSLDDHPEWEQLIPCIYGNVGFVFTNGDLDEVKEKLVASRVPAAAKAGIIAPVDYMLEKQVTILEPTKTTFFAALDITTKITRGCVEILSDVRLCKAGERVGSSESALMAMLGIKPFEYGLVLTWIFDDGYVIPAKLLETTPEDLFRTFGQGVGNVAALSLAISYPTLPAFPHVIADAFKNLVAVCLETNYMFEQAEAIKERVDNPDAFASEVVASGGGDDAPADEPSSEEESSEPEGFGDFW